MCLKWNNAMRLLKKGEILLLMSSFRGKRYVKSSSNDYYHYCEVEFWENIKSLIET